MTGFAVCSVRSNRIGAERRRCSGCRWRCRCRRGWGWWWCFAVCGDDCDCVSLRVVHSIRWKKERRICEREVGGVGWLSMAVYRRTHKVRVCVCGKVCNLKERKRNKKEREKRNKNIYIQGFDRIHGLLVIRSKQSKAHHPNDERSGSHVGTKAIAFRLKFSRR